MQWKPRDHMSTCRAVPAICHWLASPSSLLAHHCCLGGIGLT